MITVSIHSVACFWRRYPALLYAINCLLGIAFALNYSYALFVPLLLFSFPLLFFSQDRIRLLLALGVLLGAYLSTAAVYTFPHLPDEGEEGTALIEITSLSQATHFGKRWVYKGNILSFVNAANQEIARNIPFTFSMPVKDSVKHPPANSAYQVFGKLKEKNNHKYTLSVKQEAPWYPVSGSWSLAEQRFHAKQYVSQYILSHIQGSQPATFLAGIATGDFDDRLMAFEFSRFGLQHIMAISGFHFAIIAGILSVILRCVIGQRIATVLLIFLLSSYFVFLGCGPSIMRAWITITIALCGLLLEKRGSGLNSLGVAMLLILMINPLQCWNIGFQFSFLATAAILLLFPSCDILLQQLFEKRPLSQMVKMNVWNQHAYCVLVFFRQGLALTLAVNLLTMPLMFFYFQKFPVMSLLYNLFFPFLVSIAMLLLILGLLGGLFLSVVGDFFHAINSVYTQWVLNFTYYAPASLDFVWRYAGFSHEFLVVYLTLVVLLGIWVKQRLEQEQDVFQDYAFI